MKGTEVAIHRNDRNAGRAAAFADVRARDNGITGSLALLAAIVLLLFGAAGHARAATYKWVDDKGVTHYSDKMPPEAVNRGSTMLDKQAVPIKKVEPALTPEQIKAKEAETERAQAMAREQAMVARRDRALLSSYTTEGEIDLARTRVLTTIDSQLQAAQAYSSLLDKRKDVLTAKKAAAGDKGLPVGEERELEGIRIELPKQQTLIELKQKERAAAIQKYDADKARWRELRAVADANAEAAAAAGTGPRASPAPAANSGGSTAARSR
jgi:hypothetical protein